MEYIKFWYGRWKLEKQKSNINNNKLKKIRTFRVFWRIILGVCIENFKLNNVLKYILDNN